MLQGALGSNSSFQPARQQAFVTFRNLVLLLASLALLCPSGSSQPASGTPYDTAQQHSVSGQVINAITGSPIPRALVKLSSRAVFTDQEGRFEFDAGTESAASSELTAEKPGYFGTNGMKRSFYLLSQASTSPDPASPILLRLYPEAIISGTVQAADGGPFEHVNILLHKQMLIEGLKQWQIVGGAWTNAEGEFRFAELSPGDYSIDTQLVTDRTITKGGKEGYLPQRYPAATSGDDFARLHLSPGQTISLQLAPKHERFYAVSGNVAGNGAGQWARFEVRTSDREAIYVETKYDPQSGTFHMMLPNGAYEISATFYGIGNRPGAEMLGTSQVTVAGGDVQGVSIVAQPLTTIPVLVDMQQLNSSPSSPSGGPAGAGIGKVDAINYVNIQLLPLSPMDHTQPRSSSMERVGDENQLTIPNVAPGRYRAIVRANGRLYVKSATCGGDNLLRDPLTIAPGTNSNPIRILLQDDVGRIKVTFTSNGQSANGYLYLIPTDPSGQQMRELPLAYLRSSNGYTFEDIAPGNYLVLAYDSRQELEYRNPEALRQLLSLGKTVTVPPNGEATAEVEVIQTSEGEK